MLGLGPRMCGELGANEVGEGGYTPCWIWEVERVA
jgi:hypothetical protein